MKLFALVIAAACFAWPASGPEDEILALERKAMEGWQKGDPGPQLAICDPGVTVIHVMLEKRIEGLPALKQLYEQYRGRPLFDSFEMISPKVVVAGDAALLTYQLGRHLGGTVSYWNGTEVYRRTAEGWRLIHSHWSAFNPQSQ